MNFVNFKKLFVLSSALMAFGNTSYASDIKYSIEHNSDIYNNMPQNDEVNYTMIHEIIKGIESNVSDDKIKDELSKRVNLNEITKKFAKSSNDYIGVLISQETYKTMDEVIGNISDNNISDNNNVNNSFKLITILKLIKQIENIRNEFNIGNVGSNNATYDLFKKIALGIDDNSMEQLKNFIKDEYEERKNENELNIGLFASTLERISNISKYKMKDENLIILNSIFGGNRNKFVVSPNHKIHYCKTKKDYIEYDSTKNNQIERNEILEQIMDVVNTEFTMTNEQYYVLANQITTGDYKNKISNFCNNPSTKVVGSVQELSNLIKGIINGNINKKDDDNKQDNDNGNINNNNSQNNNNPQLNNNNDGVDKYNIPGISDKLPKGLYIKDIKAVKSKPKSGFNKENTFGLNDKNKLLSYVKDHCTILLDATIGVGSPNKGLLKPEDRVFRTDIGQLVKYKNFSNSEFKKLLVTPENNYLIVTIDRGSSN